jgi:hypothetical protein
MITREKALSEIHQAKNSVEKLQQASPENRYAALLNELNRVGSLVANGWPLSAEDAANLRFGLFAVRELEDKPELSDQLVALDAD